MINAEIIKAIEESEWLKEHDAKIKVEVIDECINAITDFCGGLPNNNLISALEHLKEQK